MNVNEWNVPLWITSYKSSHLEDKQTQGSAQAKKQLEEQ